MLNTFSTLFLLALAAATLLRLALGWRQIRHVAAHRGAVPEAFAVTIGLEAHQKAADYTAEKIRLAMLEALIGAVALLALTVGGLIQWISDAWAPVFASGGLAHGTALIVTIGLALSLLELPLSIYSTFVVEARFGFNRITVSLFVADMVKQAAVAVALGIPLLLLVLWLMSRMGEYWWLYVWIAWVGFNLLVLLVYPTFIAPLFNRFAPLADPELAARIDALLERCGFQSNGVFVMDGSRRSSHGNAYFTGFGSTKRIVLFDTLLARLAPAEVEAVLAHELGHFRHHHVWKRIGLLFSISLALLWVFGHIIDQPWFYEGMNISTPSTACALTLYVLVTPVFTFFLQPFASLYSRSHEFEADSYAVSHTNGDDLARALVKLYKDNAATLTPDPAHSAFYDSHPPAAIRIARLQQSTQAG